MPRQRPHVGNRRAELDADPIGEPIAERRPKRGRQPDRPEISLLERSALRCRQRRPGRNHKGYESERLAKGERENDRSRPSLVDAHELYNLLRIGLQAVQASEMPGLIALSAG